MAVEPAHDRDWAAETADRIDSLIGTVRAKTTGPLERVIRFAVYGLLCVALGSVALVLLVITAVRALDEVIPGEVWPVYVILGGIFVAVGLLLWRKRTAPRPA